MKASELQRKEVISIRTGKRLGNIVDYEIDLCTGKVTHIAVPAPGCKFTLFSRYNKDVFYQWDRIKKIGDDVILIDVDEAYPHI